jgi:hypothetical protein
MTGASSRTGLSSPTEPCSTVSALTGFDPSRETKLTERLRDRLGGIEIEQFNGDNFAVFLCSAFEWNADPDEEQDECGWTPSATSSYEAVIRAIHAHYAPTIWSLQEQLAIATEARRAETAKQGSVHEGAGPQDIAQGGQP